MAEKIFAKGRTGSQKFVSDFKKMYENELFTDFILKTSDGKTLKVHKSIIAARSPVLFTMLSSDMQEAKQGWANVPDFDSNIMREVLRFVYCNNVEDLEVLADDLIFAAEKYQIEGLKEICIESLISTLSSKNVLKSIIIAERISDASKLFHKCIDMIDRHYFRLVVTEEYKTLPLDFALKICEHLYLVNKRTIQKLLGLK